MFELLTLALFQFITLTGQPAKVGGGTGWGEDYTKSSVGGGTGWGEDYTKSSVVGGGTGWGED